jgi:DNA polymerase-3 subunit epsilon
MREILFDCETTGLSPNQGHRIVEIGAVEIINLERTGSEFHAYVNPDCDVPERAFRVHGLSTEFLAGHRRFSEIAPSLVEFIGDAPIIAHNVMFDATFLNAELATLGLPIFDRDRWTCSMALARELHPGASASLDNVCHRFGIDLSSRTKHGALIDAQLLASAYGKMRETERRRKEARAADAGLAGFVDENGQPLTGMALALARMAALRERQANRAAQ